MQRWLAILALALVPGTGTGQTAPDPANGAALAEQLCRGCHLVSPTQRGPVPDGIPSFMAVAQRPGIDARQIVATLISPPHPLMPSPPLDTRQMQDVAAYILSLRP